MESYQYTLDMDVRDYECDIQGIVNNSVYQNYLEHTRHEFLKQAGVDFAEYARQGINLVVIRAELDYKIPLTSGDSFTVGLNLVRESKLRFAFYQEIVRQTDEKLALKAKIIGTALNERGRPCMPQGLESLLGNS